MIWLRMVFISFATGLGLGMGFWMAHLLCKKMFRNRGK